MSALVRLSCFGSTYALTVARGRRHIEEVAVFRSTAAAERFLRRFESDSRNLLKLRQLLAAFHIEGVPRWSDARVVQRVAELLVQHRLEAALEPERGTIVPGFEAETRPRRDAVVQKPDKKKDEKQNDRKTWITIQLVGENDKPIKGERIRVTLPDGSTREVTLDGNGLARFTQIDPGQCKVTFLSLDEEAWVPLRTTPEP